LTLTRVLAVPRSIPISFDRRPKSRANTDIEGVRLGKRLFG
jgi:hypothetical protein